MERGPTPAIHGVVHWRLIDLAHRLYEELAVLLDETTVSRELKKLGYVKLTARPRHHAQKKTALEAFKKGGCLGCSRDPGHPVAGAQIENWFQDEARVGQKNTITRESMHR